MFRLCNVVIANGIEVVNVVVVVALLVIKWQVHWTNVCMLNFIIDCGITDAFVCIHTIEY